MLWICKTTIIFIKITSSSRRFLISRFNMMIHDFIQRLKLFFYSFVFVLFFTACHNSSGNKSETKAAEDISPPTIPYRVVNIFPHDTTSYTEGFLVHNGQLFESTGHTSFFPSSRSLFGVLDSTTGKIDVKVEIDKYKYFGEGIVFLKDRVYQLTDTTRIGFIYQASNYKKLGNFYYDGEGWGLTTNGVYLIMSNGSSNIYYREPKTFKAIKILNVSDNNGPVQNVNELELIRGFIYANQWQTDYILKIDTISGRVVGRLDLAPLKNEVKLKYLFSEETNGIAYDSVTDKIYVTGKRWPQFYEIKFNH
jgi:glutaminyl-peptide cyclotransferase